MDSIASQVRRHIKTLLPAVARKLRQKGVFRHIVFTAYRYLVWVSLQFILYIIKPFRAVKVIWIQSYGIGHLAYNTDMFLRQCLSIASEGRQVFYLGIASNPASNQQLLSMYQRKFFIIQNNLAYKLLEPLYNMRSSKVFESLWFYHDTAVPCHTFDNTNPLLEFNPSEEEKGEKLLREMGMDLHSWFICFHARDAVYMSRTYSKGDWSYHNFRDCDVRNYLEAAKYIASCNGFAVRMGEWVVEKLSGLPEARIIDYASKYRSDFGDIYLPAKAKFFLGNTAGILLVSTIFRVPVALANFVPLELITPFRAGDLFIPKKIWSTEKKRFLTFGEILTSGIGRWLRSEEYTKAGLEVIENTAQEILKLAKEMNERLDGVFEAKEEDEELQRAFHSLIKPDHYCYGTPVRMGAKFLRENKELLE